MTYTPPEGVSIGTFTADTLPASFDAPAGAVVSYKIYGTSEGAGVETESGEPAGYKIPILMNITKTDFSSADGNIEQGGWEATTGKPIGTYPSTTRVRCSNYVTVNAPTDIITIKSDLNLTGYQVSLQLTDDTGICISGVTWSAFPLSLSMAGYSDSVRRAYIFIRKSDNNTLVPSDVGKISVYVAPPNSSNYDLFIGDSKLGATEYLDFSEQKIYKDVAGTLTPTDPPAPLPAINTYKGENTLSSTETLGDIELTGDWLAIMGSIEDESIDIGFTVDAEEYIAYVTVDDGPSIQVSDTITMPSSADSFTLDAVAWGRERYTDTVYNALS